MEYIYSELLYCYIQTMQDLNTESNKNYKKSMWLFFGIGIVQMTLSLFLDTFVINKFNFNGLFVNIFNVINLLISATLNLIYISKKIGRWDLLDIFNKNLLIIMDGVIQENQLKFLTYSSSIVEHILFWNYIFNHSNDNNVNWRNFVSNISLLEMDQHKLQNIKNNKNKNINVLCRIHLDINKILKTPNSNNNINELWPFFYLNYNYTQKKLIISSHNLILYKQENKVHQKSNHLMSIPVNLISIESIQSSVFPWAFIYNNSGKMIEKDTHLVTNINMENNNLNFKNQIQQYIEILENFIFSSENQSLTINSLLEFTDTFKKKHQTNNFQMSKEFQNKLSQIFYNYNFISFYDNNNHHSGAKTPYKEESVNWRLDESLEIIKLKDDPLYILNCTIPIEYLLNMDINISFEDLVTKDEVMKLQIACFSFADLLSIYTAIS
ncbi:hypothetical protein ChUKH1_17070 [Cryptosporidium hominis]|nr:hypothetical protein ChTU502y2012_416g0005 [Cryptosporidium hominis]PPA65445.1 hypothetical protein ChUKH1_17070 [Cryptosporidium hominis]